MYISLNNDNHLSWDFQFSFLLSWAVFHSWNSGHCMWKKT